MDAASIALVQSTFQTVAPSADRLARLFYDRLFELDWSLHSMFPEDLVSQREKLIDEPHHYDLVLDALLHAMTSCAPYAVTPDAIAAWRRAYHLIAETMMHGATHGPSAPSRAG